MILRAIEPRDPHVLLNRGDRRGETLTIETVGVKLGRRQIGRANHNHALFKHFAHQAAEQYGIANIGNKKLVETQHANVLRHLAGERSQGLCRPGNLEKTFVHPAHEMMKVQTFAGHRKAVVEAIHEPGFATPDRAPKINSARFATGFQSLVAVFEHLCSLHLRRI